MAEKNQKTKKGVPESWDNIRKKVKDMKAEMLILNGAIMILGLLMIIIPEQFNQFMGQILGVGLIILGVLKCISFLRLKGEDMFGSFALVQGAAMLGFGIFFLIKPDRFGDLLTIAISLVVLLVAVLKIQNAINYMKLKISKWWVHLILAVLLLAFGIFALVRPDGIAANLMFILIGISFVVSALWDIISILFMSKVIKKTAKEAEKKSKLIATTAEDASADKKTDKKTSKKNRNEEVTTFDDGFDDPID